jgi:hypothetical protein
VVEESSSEVVVDSESGAGVGGGGGGCGASTLENWHVRGGG